MTEQIIEQAAETIAEMLKRNEQTDFLAISREQLLALGILVHAAQAE